MWTVKKIYVMFMCINACISEGSSRDYFQIITNAVDWNSANKLCSNKNGTLVRIKDLGRASNLDKLKLAAPFWSSVTGFFTPWIAYRGCFPKPTQSTPNISLSLNTVGQCFSHCKAHLGRNCTYFALQEDQCFCLCNQPQLPLADSNKCNITCNNSTEDGYCGGKQHITLYEVRDEHLYRGDGFCLAYNCTSHERVYIGRDCDEQHEGFCVNRQLELKVQSRNIWNGYSAACKRLNYYLTAHIESTSGTLPYKGFAWIGVRSYKYDNFNGNKHCYKITLESEVLVYNKSDCLTKIPFVCRTFSPFQNPDTTVTPNTEQSKNPTNKAVGLVAGSVTGALILLTATFLTILFVRKKRKARNHMPPTVQNVLYELSETGHIVDGQKDAIYINGVVKNTNSTQCTSQDADHTYIDRSEGEYDRLHTSFPKTCTNEESHYDRSDSTYSTTTRDEHTDKVYGSHYDSMASLEKNTYDSKPNEHNKVYGSHYDSMTSLEENTYDSKPNEHSNVYGSHYDTMASLEENSS